MPRKIEGLISLDLSQRVLSPQTALLVLIAACNLYLVHTVLVFLVVEAPYSSTETVVMWASGFVGLALLAFGGLVAFDTLQQLRESEARLTETKGRLHALIDASPLAITAGDVEGRILLWNAAAERMFGWAPDEILGLHYPAAEVDEETRAEWEDMRSRVLQGGVITDHRTVRRTRDGRVLHVSVSAAPVRNSNGTIEGTMAVISDVTQKRLAEQERSKLEEQLRQAQKMEAVGRLAGGVAHDFNNILTAIKGNAELLLAGDASETEAREDLREINRSADRASALTRQLLAFSRQSIVKPRPLDLNALIAETQRMLRRILGERIALETDLAHDLGTILADPGQMEQVLMNLVVNARDAIGERGRIVLRTTNAEITEPQAAAYSYRVVPGPYVALSVIDTGTGMDAETAQQIFEPFFTTKPQGIGTGLGLSTAYGIIKQARGYIWVDSEPGHGTTFLIYLPRVATAPEHEPAAHHDEPKRLPSGSETILVVEDEDAVLSLARKVLERQGYHVLTAARGREALRLAREHAGPIDLLFCDVVMPDLTGKEVTERVVRLRPGISTIMTSGYAEHVLAHDGVVDAGVEFLEKPYTPAGLLGKVREVLGAEHEATHP